MNYPATSTQIARHLVNGAITNGGATIDNLLRVPRSGYCVGMGGAHALDPARPYMDQALDIVDAHLSDAPGLAFGSWLDESNGALYIEPIQVVQSKAEALARADVRGELAIFDLANGVEIRL